MSVTYNYFLFARLAVLESFSVVQVYEVKVYIFLFTAMFLVLTTVSDMW